MISNQAPEGPAPAAVAPGGTAASPGHAPARSAGSRLRGMNVSVLREVALLPVLVLLIVVGTRGQPRVLHRVELRRASASRAPRSAWSWSARA